MTGTTARVPHAATGDCEAIRLGFIGQPINTATSLSYIVGAAIVARKGTSRRRLWAGALIALGVGSIGYHGPGRRPGKLLHDVSLPLAGMVAAAGTTRPNCYSRLTASLCVTAGCVWVVSRTDSPLCRPTSRWQWHGLWHVVSATAVTTRALGERGRECAD
jgi:hypothetical protein